jgi:epoxyqueuosine reductase
MDRALLRQEIEGEAQRLGFFSLGVTMPDPPPHFEVYEHWLAQDYHAGMDYLANERSRQRRADPRRIMPDCRSILLLGFPYPPAPDLGETDSGMGLLGRVASYAWGADYHDLLAERMHALVIFIEARLGERLKSRWYTDTGPLLERDLAQRAGLGWIGKNTCLIHPRRGSYFFLAEVLLDLELTPDAPFIPDRCGACTRCLEACPTGCILPDRTIDSRRCISYLTIELKGAMPGHLRAQVGDWVFGCDVCQQVCPWNQRFSWKEVDPALAPRPGVSRPDLLQELSLSPEAFNHKFTGSPVKRAKRRGYLRNVAVALGNHLDPVATPALERALLTDPEPLLRGHSAWALGRISGAQARQALYKAIQIEADPVVRTEIQMALDGEK